MTLSIYSILSYKHKQVMVFISQGQCITQLLRVGLYISLTCKDADWSLLPQMNRFRWICFCGGFMKCWGAALFSALLLVHSHLTNHHSRRWNHQELLQSRAEETLTDWWMTSTDALKRRRAAETRLERENFQYGSQFETCSVTQVVIPVVVGLYLQLHLF